MSDADKKPGESGTTVTPDTNTPAVQNSSAQNVQSPAPVAQTGAGQDENSYHEVAPGVQARVRTEEEKAEDAKLT